jgi:hypothetical protein
VSHILVAFSPFSTLIAPQLTLEWSRLSEYTGNDTYRELAVNSVLKIVNNVSGTIYVFPLINLSRYSQCLFQVRFLQLR